MFFFVLFVKVLPYSKLQESVGIKDVRTLEDLIIGSIYAGLLVAKIDQANASLIVHSAMGRDVTRNDVATSTFVLW